MKEAWYESLNRHIRAVEALEKEIPSKDIDFTTTLSATQSSAQAVLIAQGDRQIELLEGILAGVKKLW